MTSKTSRAKVLLAWWLVCSALLNAAPGQTVNQKKSLQGLGSVFVVVQPVNDDAARDGLNQAHLQGVVESILHQADIPVAKQPEPENGLANLIVTVDTIKVQGAYLFTVSVGVVQAVQLTRRAEVGTVAAQTWSVDALGVTTPQRLDIIDEPLKAKVGDFVAAFKAANAQ